MQFFLVSPVAHLLAFSGLFACFQIMNQVEALFLLSPGTLSPEKKKVEAPKSKSNSRKARSGGNHVDLSQTLYLPLPAHDYTGPVENALKVCCFTFSPSSLIFLKPVSIFFYNLFYN